MGLLKHSTRPLARAVIFIFCAFHFPAAAEIWGIKSRAVTGTPSLLFHFNEDGSSLTAVTDITVGGTRIFVDGLAITMAGDLYAFQLDTNNNASRLVTIDKGTAVATPVGPFLANRDIRGACITKNGQLLALDVLSNQVLNISLPTGTILGSPVPLSAASSPYHLSVLCDLAQRADGTFFLGDGNDTNLYRLDVTSGALSHPVVPPTTNGGLRLVGLGFSREAAPSHAFVFDEVNLDDVFIYDTEDGFRQTKLLANIFSSFNSGTGDLAAQAFVSELVLSIDRDINLCFDTLATTNYQVEYQSSFTTNQWLSLGAPIQGTGSRTCLVDGVQGQPQRFYRVRQF